MSAASQEEAATALQAIQAAVMAAEATLNAARQRYARRSAHELLTAVSQRTWTRLATDVDERHRAWLTRPRIERKLRGILPL